jgi:hypothetical protein
MTIVARPAASSGSALTTGEETTEHEQKLEEAKREIQQLEQDPPEKLEDWPEGQPKY